MNSQCLPFRLIPHTTNLFLDYLDFAPAVQQFYPRSPNFLEWACKQAELINYPGERRKQIADLLERQNREFGASAKTFEHISSFRNGSCALVTGQQVGLFGGPVFSIYKALSAVKLSQEAQKLGIDCVPIFWLATEDHDLDEVNQANIPNAQGTLERLAVSVNSAPDTPVGKIQLGSGIQEALSRVADLLGDPEMTARLGDAYSPHETFGTAFGRLFAGIFADFGVILLDGSDPELDRIAAPLFRAALERSAELNAALLRRNQELDAAQYHQQVRVTPNSTLLFKFENGARVPIHSQQPGEFTIGDHRLSSDQALDFFRSAPQSFSPNVLLRPVIQDFLLPTLAYVGGAAEVAYFAQAGVVYEKLLGRITPILPRFSATLIEAKPKALLEKYRLSWEEVLLGPSDLREKIGAHLLPPSLQASFDDATAAVERTMAALEKSLAELDKSLTDSARNAQSKMLYQITNLRSRASRAELRQSEIIGRHADLLSTFLFPEKALQEREFAGIYFLAKHGGELLKGLLSTIHPDCLDHQLITIP
jgi:bacillithiol biosynthesis cysteine-adding enzyme BshC